MRGCAIHLHVFPFEFALCRHAFADVLGFLAANDIVQLHLFMDDIVILIPG